MGSKYFLSSYTFPIESLMLSLKSHKSFMKKKISEFHFSPESSEDSVETVIDNIYKDMCLLTKYYTHVYRHFKFQIRLNVKLSKFRVEFNDNLIIRPWFVSSMQPIYSKFFIKKAIKKGLKQVLGYYDAFIEQGSNWRFEKVKDIKIVFLKIKPLVGGCFIYELPPFLLKKRGLLNIRCRDDLCFFYCISAALFPYLKQKKNLACHYKQFLDKLKFGSFPIPMPIYLIPKFERMNEISINVFTYYRNRIEPIFVTTYRQAKTHVNLLYFKGHFVLITNLSKLLSSLYSYNRKKSYYCMFCLCKFHSVSKFKSHMLICRKNGFIPRLPIKDAFMKFNNFGFQIKRPFIIYADFETMNVPIEKKAADQNSEKTIWHKQHIPISFGAILVSKYPQFNQKPFLYKGPKCIETFISYLRSTYIMIQSFVSRCNRQPLKLTEKDKIKIRLQKKCYLCKKSLDQQLLARDHDHITGEFIGLACLACNLRFNQLPTSPIIPVIFHNLEGFDSHLLLSEIGNYVDVSEIKIVPRNSEKVLSFKLWNYQFLDSINFLPASLQVLADNLSNKGYDCFPLTESSLPLEHKNKLSLLTKKGVFPYSYITSLEILEEKTLPPKESFYDILKKQHITDEEYQHAQKVWLSFDCQNLGDYHDIYLRSDICILADVFENFRNLTLETYKLDPICYLTGASLFFDAMLKMTEIKLELIKSIDIYQMFQDAIRGGVCFIGKRYAKANNSYLADFNKEEESSFIAYFDQNNLYGGSMCECIPHSEFCFISDKNYDLETIINTSPDAETGYLLEVDLTYPTFVHDQHDIFPMAPEHLLIHKSYLSPMNQRLLETLNLKHIPTLKLVPNLMTKTRYVVYYVNLKFYLQHGLQVSKIHRIISFKQSKWLQSYINFNTTKRIASTNAFDKAFYKLANNAVYGKTIENSAKRTTVRLVSGNQNIDRLVSLPNFKSFKIYNKQTAGLQFSKTIADCLRPVYVGAIVLELAKYHMYKVLYDYFIPKFPKLSLLYTDTDSLILQVFCKDLYQEIKEDYHIFDFSNFPADSFIHNTRNQLIPLYLKDEFASVFPNVISEFIGLRSKMYAFKVSNSTVHKVAKGVKRPIIEDLKFDQYLTALFSINVFEHEFFTIRSFKHKIITVLQKKKSLSPIDDKRFLLSDNIHSRAYGHFRNKYE